jgi:hypothetical protein
MRILLVLIFLSVNFIAIGKIQDSLNPCSNYRVGNFYVINAGDTCTITRTENRQIEQCQGSTTSYELIVIWIKKDKCILRDVHYNPSTKPYSMRNDVLMTVMDVFPTYYTVHLKTRGRKPQYITVYCNNQPNEN